MHLGARKQGETYLWKGTKLERDRSMGRTTPPKRKRDELLDVWSESTKEKTENDTYNMATTCSTVPHNRQQRRNAARFHTPPQLGVPPLALPAFGASVATVSWNLQSSHCHLWSSIASHPFNTIWRPCIPRPVCSATWKMKKLQRRPATCNSHHWVQQMHRSLQRKDAEISRKIKWRHNEGIMKVPELHNVVKSCQIQCNCEGNVVNFAAPHRHHHENVIGTCLSIWVWLS